MGRPKKSSIEKSISAQTLKTEHEKPATKKKNAKSIPQEGTSKKCSQECKSKPKAPKDGHCSPNDNKCSSKSNTIKKCKNTRRSLDINTQPKKRVRVKEEEKESNSGETEVKCPQKRATKKRSRCTDLKRGMSPPGVELGNHCHGETLAHQERHLRSGNSSGQSTSNPRQYQRHIRDARLLEDRTLGYHAWSLWSSDQRRPYQQENPDASVESIDARLRKTWTAMGDKEKLKYYLRALRAHQRGRGYKRRSNRNDREHALNKSNDTLATSLDLDTFCASPKDRQKTMVSNSIVHLQRRLPGEYFNQMSRTLHCPYGSSCQIMHSPFSQSYPGHEHRTCCSDQKSNFARVDSKTIWQRLTAEERQSRSVNVEYSRWRIAHNHSTCHHMISRVIQDPPHGGDWFSDDSTWLGQLLEDLNAIEKGNHDTDRNNNNNNIGKCNKGHDVIAQIAEELEASTSHVFHFGKDVVRVPAILNVRGEMSIMADAVSLNTVQPLEPDEVQSYFDSYQASSAVDETRSSDININEVLDLLQKTLYPDNKCNV